MSKSKRIALVLVFYVYIALLLYFLFLSDGRYVMDSYKYNLEPFKEISRFIKYRHNVGFVSFIMNIAGNIAGFMPFGFFVPQISKEKVGFIKILFVGAVFSLTIETVQLLLKVGRFDVDDIIMNTLGTVLGYIVYAIFKFIKSQKSSSTNGGKCVNKEK